MDNKISKGVDMYKKSQKGFTTVLAFIVIAAVAGGAAYFVISQNNKSTQINEQAAQESDASSVIAKAKTTDVAIKEWGVSFAVAKAATDTVYAISLSDKNVAYLSSTTAVKLSDECSPLKTSIMALSRSAKGTYDDKKPASTTNQKPVAIVGDFEYVLNSAQASCLPASTKATDNALVIAFKAAISSGIKTLKASK